MVIDNLIEQEFTDGPFIKKNQSRKWSLIRDVVSKTVGSKFTTRDRTSLTQQETSFLELLESSKKNRAARLDLSLKPAFADVVEAAVAREKLRVDVSNRLPKLAPIEVQFLKELVECEEVTAEQLLHADDVLNRDPLYRLAGEVPKREIRDDSETAISANYLEIILSQDGDDCVEMNNQCDLNHTKHYIQIKGNDIEVSLIPNKQCNCPCRQNSVLAITPTKPSKYSYRTWELTMFQDKTLDFSILGISDNIVEKNRVLSPPMMESLRKHLPFVISEDNFWLKYNMTRDGASIPSLFNSVRQSSRTLIAIETTNGEVFGCFVSSPWRNNNTFYGSCEAFLWRLKKSRFTPTSSLNEQIQLESDIETFLWSTENRNIQFSTEKKIAIGGGYPSNHDSCDGEQNKDWGLGIALDAELYKVTSSPCATFGDNISGSPPLFKSSSEGDVFKVANLEVWAFTPCFAVDKAEQLEMGRMFVLSHF